MRISRHFTRIRWHLIIITAWQVVFGERYAQCLHPCRLEPPNEVKSASKRCVYTLQTPDGLNTTYNRAPCNSRWRADNLGRWTCESI